MFRSTLMNLLRNHGWRLALISSGVVMLIAGPMHPEAEASDSMRQELATMTADDRWVPGHALIVLSTVLLALGLWTASRTRAWPKSVHRALRLAVVAVSLYVVETVFHLASAVDTDALQAGEGAPVAFTHVALAAVLYPVSGLAIAFLASKLWRAWASPQKLLAVPGIVGGMVHAFSVPLTLTLPDAELTPAFAGASILIAIWSVSAGIVGIRSQARRPAREAVPASPDGNRSVGHDR